MIHPEEKEIIAEDILRIIGVVRTLFREDSLSREHMVACLNDRKIEIQRGEYDD
jgi:hypothetical protein